MPAEDPDFSRALKAMTAPELRAFVRGVLDELDPDARTAIAGALIARAVKGRAGWKPSRPAQRIVDDAKSFAEAARVVGYADPADVSEHLRLAGKAFLAGDHATAREVFEALLLPLAAAEIDLGEHELIDEVLTVDAHTCVAQYVTSVYTTTPVNQRADAVLRAMDQVRGVSSLLNPIKEMEDVSAGGLALESGTRSRFEDWPEATVFQTGAFHLATGFRGFSSRTASGASELSVIADTGIATQAVFCQRVAVMVAAEKNRCLPVVAWLKPIERLSGSLLNAGRDNFRDNPGDNASVRKSNRVVYLGNSSR